MDRTRHLFTRWATFLVVHLVEETIPPGDQFYAVERLIPSRFVLVANTNLCRM
jgi:hypothetical protein